MDQGEESRLLRFGQELELAQSRRRTRTIFV
jgi:hypothetical protein